MYLLFLLIAGRFPLGGRDCHKENPQLILWVSHSLHHITSNVPVMVMWVATKLSNILWGGQATGCLFRLFLYTKSPFSSVHTDGSGYRCNSELLSSVQIWLGSITMTTWVKSSKLPLLLAKNGMERLNIGQTSEHWQYCVIFVLTVASCSGGNAGFRYWFY